ncbi:hypothetical protein SprV_0802513000 [Sparganum proliferum]
MSPRVPPTRRPSPSLQENSEDFPEASADHPGQLGRPLPRPSNLEEDSENRRSASPPPKPNARLANPNCAYLATPTFNQPRPAHAASERSGHQLQHPDYTTAVSSSNSASSSTRTTNIDRTSGSSLPSHSSSSSSYSYSSSSHSSIASTSATATPLPITSAHNPDTPTNINPPPSTAVMWTRPIPVLIATAPSPHTSVLRIYRTETGDEPAPLASTYTRRSSHLHHAISFITSIQSPPPKQKGSVSLGSVSMLPLCCMSDSSLRPSRRVKRRGLEGC